MQARSAVVLLHLIENRRLTAVPEFELRDVRGWTSHEVCEALDLSEGNQRVLLHRARGRVRRELDQYLADDRATS